MKTNNHIHPTAVERAAQARQQELQRQREQRWESRQPDLDNPPPRWDGGMLMLGAVLTLCAVVYGTLFLIWIL